MAISFGVPRSGGPRGWPHSNEEPIGWKVDESEDVLEALGRIPPELWGKGIRGIYRMRRSKDHPNPASSNDGNIVLYDPAFEKHPGLARVLTHELAHEKYRALSREEKRSYWMATNWMNESGDPDLPPIVSRGSGFVEPDGKSSPYEDFANNVEYFLFEPEKLKAVTPHAYTWIKNHFGDNFRLGGVGSDAK